VRRGGRRRRAEQCEGAAKTLPSAICGVDWRVSRDFEYLSVTEGIASEQSGSGEAVSGTCACEKDGRLLIGARAISDFLPVLARASI